MGSDPPGGTRDDEGIVRPEELDFTKDDRVATIDEGRYVVSSSGESPPEPPDDESGGGGGATGKDRSPADILRELGERLDEVDQPHGFAAAARFGGEIDRHAILSDDLPAMFEDLLTWTASNVDDDAPPEVVLGILLLSSGQSVRFPVRTFEALVSEHGLSYDDSIGDLAERLAADGFRLPPNDTGDG